jgi:hypothetical protein
VQPIFDARSRIHVPAVEIGQFYGDIPEFQTFEMQKLDDVTVLEFHLSGAFQSLAIYLVVLPDISSRDDPRFS